MDQSVKDRISDFINNKKPSETKEEFYMWLFDKQERHSKLSSMDSLWNDIPTTTTSDTHIALENFLAKVQSSTSEEKIQKNTNRTLKSIFLSIAATIAIILISSYFTRQYFTPPAQKDIVMNEVVASLGKIEKVILPDGSKITLNSGSSLLYPSHFSEEKRYVHLIGEAFFEVEGNDQQPFFVKSNIQEVRVTGTKFNITAYPDGTDIRTTLVEGSVEVVYANHAQIYQLQPSEQTYYSKENHTVQKLTIDIDDELAWMKGQLRLREATVSEILLAMEKRYNVSFQYNASRLNNDRYNITFRVETDLEDALLILNHLVGPMSYNMDNDNICKLTFY